MNPVLTALIVGIVAGVLLGWWLGRRAAEMGRARHDMRQTWQGRGRYRK